MAEGYIYAMSNRDYLGCFKIGMTTKTPQERAKSLSAVTGVRSPFEVFDAVRTPCVEMHEKIMHERLDAWRDSPSKEFFTLPASKVSQAFESLRQAVSSSVWWQPLIPTESHVLPASCVDDLRHTVPREMYLKAENLELNEDGTCPYTMTRRGVFQTNFRVSASLPQEAGGGGWVRKTLRTQDPEEALERLRLVMMTTATEIENKLNESDMK